MNDMYLDPHNRGCVIFYKGERYNLRGSVIHVCNKIMKMVHKRSLSGDMYQNVIPYLDISGIGAIYTFGLETLGIEYKTLQTNTIKGEQ